MVVRSKVAAAWSACVLLGASVCSPRTAVAADLIVLTDQGAVPGVRELATAFARASGHTVSVLQDSGATLARRINEGPGDLMTGNPERIAELVKPGKLVAGTATPFALASLGVSVRAGAPKPDISTVEAYKAALLAAKSIGYSYGCSGMHVAEGIEKLGLTAALQASGLFEDDLSGDWLSAGQGVWGKKVASSHILRDRDRLEVYRPLTVDPKVARRERFVRQGAKKAAGLFAKRRLGAKAGY